jgi:transposase
VAVEASGGWYWLMTELEAAGLEPHLADPYEAKSSVRLAGSVSKNRRRWRLRRQLVAR